MEILRKLQFFFEEKLTSVSLIFDLVNLDIIFSSQTTVHLTGLLPIIGYAIVFASLIDFGTVLFPLQLQNPVWELQTISTLVEQNWAFLIGLGFILTRYFQENQEDVRFLEIVFLKFIRWFLLIFAVAFLFAIPLVIVDTNRVQTLTTNQIILQQNDRVAEITQLEKRLTGNLSPQELALIGKSLNISRDWLKLSPVQLQQTLRDNITKLKTNLIQEAKQAQENQKITLIKNSFRTLIGLILSSFIFLIIWFKIGQAFS